MTDQMEHLFETTLEKYVDVITCDDNVSCLNTVQCALKYGCSDNAFQTIIKAASDLSVRGPNGYSLLYYAELGGSLERVKPLILLGLDINARCFKGLTPLGRRRQ